MSIIIIIVARQRGAVQNPTNRNGHDTIFTMAPVNDTSTQNSGDKSRRDIIFFFFFFVVSSSATFNTEFRARFFIHIARPEGQSVCHRPCDPADNVARVRACSVLCGLVKRKKYPFFVQRFFFFFYDLRRTACYFCSLFITRYN